MPKLKNLTIIFTPSNNQTELSNSLLMGLNNIRVFIFVGSKLKFIEQNLFHSCCSQLQGLNFSSNTIERIESQAFVSLQDLLSLDLSHNRLTNLPLKLFYSLRHLRLLKLNHNKLRSIDQTLFKNLRTLQFLDLSTNRLKTIQFPELLSLSEIYLDDNAISNISSSMMKNLTSLDKFSALNNPLQFVSKNAFAMSRVNDISFGCCATWIGADSLRQRGKCHDVQTEIEKVKKSQ